MMTLSSVLFLLAILPSFPLQSWQRADTQTTLIGDRN
jgi:hypothetical protein